MTSASPARVLLIDDDETLRRHVERALAPHYCVRSVPGVPEAEPILAGEEIKVIVCDDQMPGETGLMFLARIREQWPFTRRILLTGNDERSALVFAINEIHVFQYLIKPAPIEELLRLVHAGVAGYNHDLAAAHAADEGQRLRLTVAKHLQAPRAPKPSLMHERRAWLQLVIWGGTAAAAVLGLGICVLVALYLLKTWFGIDFFENRHLSDWW